MASIVKDTRGKSPFWICCYTTAQGRRLKKSTKQKNQTKAMEICLGIERAERLAKEGVLTEHVVKKVMGEMLERTTGKGIREQTAEAFFETWLTGKTKVRKKKTMDRYEQVVRDFKGSLVGRAKLPLSAITVADVSKYRDEIVVHCANKTANNAVKIISSAFNFALRQHLIPLNPCTALESLPENASGRETFTVSQVIELVKHAPTQDWKRAIPYGFYTGARHGDVANAKRTSVDFKAKILRFRAEKNDANEHAPDIIIPLHPDLESVLRDCPADEEFLFPSLAGKPIGGVNGLSGQFNEIMKAAGIEPKIIQHNKNGGRETQSLTFHSLRHSFNSELANAGVDQELRMKLTGHTQKETNKIYTHHELAPLRAAIARLPSISHGGA